MLDSLRELHRIPIKHNHQGQAFVVSEMLRLHAEDARAFESLLLGVDMWGGAGAVWEVGGLMDDNREFQLAIIRLAEQRDQHAIGTERSRWIADVFRQWQ